ncbi:MAG: porin [Pseudomonadota bacterium]
MKNQLVRMALGLSATALAVNAAYAQSSISIYGNIDLALDRVGKSAGNVQGTVYGLANNVPVPNAVASPKTTVTRVAPSLTSQSKFGFKGSEDLGDGYKAGFTLEGGINADNGTLSNDGRLFGKLAFVNLSTPYGEVRIGRQMSPMLIGYFLSSTERLGTTDMMGAGLVTNTLQTYQDNMVAYLLKQGPWLTALSYSPNAGVASRISAARAPAATEASGQMVGGASAAAETADGRGRTEGALLAYTTAEWTLLAAYHQNRFGNAPVGLATAGGFVPLYVAESYKGYVAGVKYKVPASGTTLAVNYALGRFALKGPDDPDIRTIAAGVKHPVGAFELSAQYVDTRFANYTRGKDAGVMLGLEYNLSRRTALFMRGGYLKDKRGSVVSSPTGVPLAGGPSLLLLPLGALEVPLYSGAGQNMDATTRILAVGIRHAF